MYHHILHLSLQLVEFMDLWFWCGIKPVQTQNTVTQNIVANYPEAQLDHKWSNSEQFMVNSCSLEPFRTTIYADLGILSNFFDVGKTLSNRRNNKSEPWLFDHWEMLDLFDYTEHKTEVFVYVELCCSYPAFVA